MFHKHTNAKDGHRARCKACISVASEIYYQKNEARIKERVNASRVEHPDRKQATNRAYRKNNRAKKNEWAKKWLAEKYHSDIEFKLTSGLRCRLYQALKNSHKAAATLELLGCTISELKIHLESKFLPGMTWENHTRDGWHVDHIIPCAAFDLTKEEEQRKCFHYTNLQPLWWFDNIKKAATIPYSH
jgi:hypothetical protein